MARSVLMFCPQFRPLVGGAERQAEKLAKALVQKGVHIKVLTPQFDAETLTYEDNDGVEIHRFPLFDLCKQIPWVRGLGSLNLLLIRTQIIHAMNKHLQGVDVVHMHTASSTTAFAAKAAKRKGIPVLCKVAMAGERNDLSELIAIGLGGGLLCRTIVRDLDRWVATTIAVSDTLQKWNIPQERITRIPNGVDIPAIDNHAEIFETAKRFLYLGRLSTNSQRDVPTLIHAFDRLSDQVPNIELALVGDGDLYQTTAALVSKCRNHERIQMPGLQDPEPWLRWADCFVLPSRREGLSNALLEAMAHGLPCIANDIPPNREVLDNGNAGVLVPIEDERRLLDEMHGMATDITYVAKMGKAAQHRAQLHYTIEAVADKYITLYDELTNCNVDSAEGSSGGHNSTTS